MTDLPEIDTCIFDMGGVVVEYLGWEHLLKFPGWPPCLGAESLSEWFIRKPHVRDFETGRISWEEFAGYVRAELGLEYDIDTMRAAMISVLGEEVPGIAELLDELMTRVRLLGLSNTNRLHWDYIMENYPVMSCFERIFTSFELGILKPRREAYELAILKADVEPEKTVFIDDNDSNLRTAEQIGFRIIHACGTDSVRAGLVSLGILPNPGEVR